MVHDMCSKRRSSTLMRHMMFYVGIKRVEEFMASYAMIDSIKCTTLVVKFYKMLKRLNYINNKNKSDCDLIKERFMNVDAYYNGDEYKTLLEEWKTNKNTYKLRQHAKEMRYYQSIFNTL